MKERKHEAPSAGPTPAATGTKQAEKVHSSRYEWERRSGEAEPPIPKTNAAARGTLLRTFATWLKKLFAADFFDKDDDATPSAA